MNQHWISLNKLLDLVMFDSDFWPSGDLCSVFGTGVESTRVNAALLLPDKRDCCLVITSNDWDTLVAVFMAPPRGVLRENADCDVDMERRWFAILATSVSNRLPSADFRVSEFVFHSDFTLADLVKCRRMSCFSGFDKSCCCSSRFDWDEVNTMDACGKMGGVCAWKLVSCSLGIWNRFMRRFSVSMWNRRLLRALCWNKSNSSNMPRRVVSLPSMWRSSSETSARSFVFTRIFVISLVLLLRSMWASAREPFGHIRFLNNNNNTF